MGFLLKASPGNFPVKRTADFSVHINDSLKTRTPSLYYPQKALQLSSRVSREMKKSFAKVYAIYFLSLITSYFTPMFILKLGAEKMSKPFTMAFSNTPGVLRKFNYKEVETLGMMTSFVCSGRCAMSIGILSYAEQIQFSVTMDSCITESPKEIRRRFEQSIDEMLEIASNIEMGSKDIDEKEVPSKGKLIKG